MPLQGFHEVPPVVWRRCYERKIKDGCCWPHWMDGWTDVYFCVHRRMGPLVGEWVMGGWMDGLIDRWINGCMEGPSNGECSADYLPLELIIKIY